MQQPPQSNQSSGIVLVPSSPAILLQRFLLPPFNQSTGERSKLIWQPSTNRPPEAFPARFFGVFGLFLLYFVLIYWTPLIKLFYYTAYCALYQVLICSILFYILFFKCSPSQGKMNLRFITSSEHFNCFSCRNKKIKN